VARPAPGGVAPAGGRRCSPNGAAAFPKRFHAETAAASQESRGFTGLRVNARDLQNVSGCKSDVLDCPGLPTLKNVRIRASKEGLS
jgi:hypothetical protein